MIPNLSETEQYNSVNQAQIDAARAAGNVWEFNGKQLQMYVAEGGLQVQTNVLDSNTKEETGAILTHVFEWSDERRFAERENAFVTTMRRVGRSNDQQINTTEVSAVDAKLYSNLIGGGILLVPKGNGEFEEIEKSRDEMLEYARLFPEAAAEAIESWLESANFKILNEDRNSFDWMFTAQSVIKVLWYMGEEDDPLYAGIVTFKSPTSEVRKRYNEEVQTIKSKKQGDTNIAQVSENFGKKLQYGLQHLVNVEGIAIGAEGVKFSKSLDKDFVIKFNPIWFVQAVELMHESFNFTRGKPVAN